MRIFLSYSSADRDLADRIRLALIAQRHAVFFDRTDLAPGLEYDSRIAEEIQQAHLFIFLISPDAISAGRYTLNELGLVQRRWKHPAGHVLPVMIRATPVDHVPPYLKAVTILQPTGDIPAEVVDYVRRISPPWPRWWRWAFGGAAVGILVGVLWGLSGMSPQVRQASDLLQSARSFQSAGEYASAWEKILEARTGLTQSPFTAMFQRSLMRDVAVQQVNVATAWLIDMRLKEGEQFSAIASRLLPTLDEAIAAEAGERKADLLAYRGWADFLRSRDSGQKLSPDKYYRQALAIDPANVYAHTMWGHWITWTHGKLDDAREHFTAALASGRQRAFVREYQFSALGNLGGDAGDLEALRIAYDMLEKKEPIPDYVRRQISRTYISACGNAYRNTVAKLAEALSDMEHMTLLRSLFPSSGAGLEQPYWVLPCLARLQEHAGLITEALETYRAIKSKHSPQDSIWPVANDAIIRLSKANG